MSTFWKVCIFILVTELCERLAFYGLTGSLTLFLSETLGFANDMATEVNSLFNAVVYITPILGAFVADVYWGRYKTIMFFCMWYILGMIMCTFGSFPQLPTALRTAIFLIGLFTGVAVGAGGIKSNVVVLGADQFVLPDQKREQDAFFNWFYWAINIGAAFALGFLPVVALDGLFVAKEYGFFVSYLIPTMAFVVGLSIFVAGAPRYKMMPPQGSALTSFFQTMRTVTNSGARRGGALLIGTTLLPVSFLLVIASLFAGDWKRSIAIIGTACIFCALPLIAFSGHSVAWMRPTKLAMQDVAGEVVEVGGELAADVTGSLKDAMDVMRVLPLACCCVVFWAVYSQMTGNFQLQGCQMDCRIAGTPLPPPVLNVFDSAIIMILVPVVDKIVYPALHRLGCPLGLLTKIGLGFFFAGCSMICAAMVEVARKNSPLIDPFNNLTAGIYSPCNSTVTEKLVLMNSLSIWWQIPQYAFVGLGEIFAAITSYELFYSQVPDAMRSVCQSVNLLCTALGSLAVAGLNAAMSAWIPDNLNNGKLEYVFLVLTGIMATNILIYTYLARGYEYRIPHAADIGDDIDRPRIAQVQPLSDRLLSPQQPSSTN
ncbi:hypothetical protein AB1Y20_002518 [Prymnesium parvum]|uniref:Uncharacterized protein n=1 Tax=Prymnesium parvum TaxID=97485 RepID=A0AB34JBK4_PRYPA